MNVTPDLQGFADAQDRLRTTFGVQVRFFSHAAMIYDPALSPTEFDDEGIPLDPLAGASAIASANVEIANLTVVGSAQANVVFRPLQTSLMRRDQTYETPLAIRGGLNKDLILGRADLPLASGATHFQLGSTASDGSWVPEDSAELWKISDIKPDDTIGTYERVIVYGQGTR